MANRKRQRGSAMVEFVIAGIAGITLLISTIQLGMAMWNYHTIGEAVHETNRYIASHGRGCMTGGNSCAITVGNIATKLKEQAVGIPDSTIKMTLTSDLGTVITCDPLSTCESDGTQWPPAANFENSPGYHTTLTASVTIHSAIVALWYGTSGQRISSITLPSTSRMRIVF